MPFPFLYVCDLLESLQGIWTRDPPLLRREAERISKEVIERWFVNHRPRIDTETDGLVLLSTLLPEKRPERIYMLQVKTLEKLVGRALALPSSRRSDLERWRQPGAGDLGDCVERVHKQGEIVTLSRAKDISIEDIDSVLLGIASRSRFSSPCTKAFQNAGKCKDARSDLGIIFSRLRARESKWLTRLILKTYTPVVLDAPLVYRLYHYLLPRLLKFQNQLPAALHLLASLGADSSISSIGNDTRNQLDVLKNLRPLVGVKVGRPFFFQGRSIKHCVDMAQNRRMSVEKKYDGEYFQLHIDMSKPRRNCIKIFSKNGRDSTEDRIAVHKYVGDVVYYLNEILLYSYSNVIRQCLELDEPHCEISTMCILEGELLVYSDKDNKILEFHKIRKHVSRSGSFLGAQMDSQSHHYEHLMLMFFDILALDKEQVLGLKQHERRWLLERIVRRIPGRAELADYQTIRFSSPGAATALRTVFANCIANRDEGLVLKPADEPYFNFENSYTYRSCCIKLKKEAFGNFGDVGDFAIVGATYDPVKAKTYRIPFLQWTDFYIGCLENKDNVLSTDMKPRFVVVTTVSLSQQILEALVHTHHIVSIPYGNTVHFDLRIENGVNQGRKPSIIFTNPPVVDIRCFGFNKNGNTGFWTMRFPAVTKLHTDRTFLDTISFVELQRMAEKYNAFPKDKAREELRWIKLLKASDPRGIPVDASTDYTSSSDPTTPSPRRRLLEDSEQRPAFFIQEDTAERRQQIPDRDIFIVDNFSVMADRLTNFVGSPVMIERRPGPLSLTSSTIQKKGPSSKRKREARLETSVQHSKRQKSSNSPSSSYLHFPASDNPPVTQPTVSHLLSDITDSSMKLFTSPKLGKSLSTIQKSSSEAAASQIGDSTKRKSSLARGLPHPMPPNLDSPSSAHRGNQATDKSVPFPNLEYSIRRNPEAALNMWKGNSICQQASASCLFVDCSLLLAPCVARMTQLKEDHLPSQGACFILDPSLWLNRATFPRRYSFTKQKIRRLALVEPRMAQETLQIFKAIQDLNLIKDDGKREWVEVYDFRIMACASKMEMGIRLGYDIWRHFWIGAA